MGMESRMPMIRTMTTTATPTLRRLPTVPIRGCELGGGRSHPSGLTVMENQPVGTVVGQFAVIDPDPLDTHTVTLVNDLNANGSHNHLFTIDACGLRLSLDFENNASAMSLRAKVKTKPNQGVLEILHHQPGQSGRGRRWGRHRGCLRFGQRQRRILRRGGAPTVPTGCEFRGPSHRPTRPLQPEHPRESLVERKRSRWQCQSHHRCPGPDRVCGTTLSFRGSAEQTKPGVRSISKPIPTCVNQVRVSDDRPASDFVLSVLNDPADDHAPPFESPASPDDGYSTPDDSLSSPDDHYQTPDGQPASPSDGYHPRDQGYQSPDDHFSSPSDDYQTRMTPLFPQSMTTKARKRSTRPQPRNTSLPSRSMFRLSSCNRGRMRTELWRWKGVGGWWSGDYRSRLYPQPDGRWTRLASANEVSPDTGEFINPSAPTRTGVSVPGLCPKLGRNPRGRKARREQAASWQGFALRTEWLGRALDGNL